MSGSSRAGPGHRRKLATPAPAIGTRAEYTAPRTHVDVGEAGTGVEVTITSFHTRVDDWLGMTLRKERPGPKAG